jgi:deoxyribodipyrimidine photo-lyase
MSKNSPTIVWFRNDLRLTDNPALYHAIQNGDIIPVFIYDVDAMDRDFGSAQKVWLHHGLVSLAADLKKHDTTLLVKKGDSQTILEELVKTTGAQSVMWNRSYEAWSIERDSKIKSDFTTNNIDVQSHKGQVMFEPWTIKNGSGLPYKVFTPFFKKCCEDLDAIGDALPAPQSINGVTHDMQSDDLDLLPPIDWNTDLASHWNISESGAWNRMSYFFENGLRDYKDGRDVPSNDYTSKLSPYLRWGMISPRSIWHETNMYAMAHDIPDKTKQKFLAEIGWREFSFNLIYHFPTMSTEPLQERFRDFPWRYSDDDLKAWQVGQTGYPMIDAGMRQLYQTGWMHNRIRMIVGSLLVKHLLLNWKDGEEWFWDCLFDACPASNIAGWQWIGGCGADAAPYFRIFNPITQGDKFDAYGYVREFVPELKNMPDKYLFNPWDAPAGDLKMAGVTLGDTYPKPIIDHSKGRERALEAFSATKINP